MAGRVAEPAARRERRISPALRLLIRRASIAVLTITTAVSNIAAGTGIIYYGASPYLLLVTAPLCFVGLVLSFAEIAKALGPRRASDVVSVGGYRFERRHLYQQPAPILARLFGITPDLAEQLHQRMNPWVTFSWPLLFWVLASGSLGAAIASLVANSGLQSAWVMLVLLAGALVTSMYCTYRGEP